MRVDGRRPARRRARGRARAHAPRGVGRGCGAVRARRARRFGEPLLRGGVATVATIVDESGALALEVSRLRRELEERDTRQRTLEAEEPEAAPGPHPGAQRPDAGHQALTVVLALLAPARAAAAGGRPPRAAPGTSRYAFPDGCRAVEPGAGGSAADRRDGLAARRRG